MPRRASLTATMVVTPMKRLASAWPCEFMPAKPSTRPGIRNLPEQSMTREFFGIEIAAREPTSVIRPSRTTTTASSMSFAERPQLVTSTTVPPASTSGGGDWGLDGACGQAETTARTDPIAHSERRRKHFIGKTVFREFSHSRTEAWERCGTWTENLKPLSCPSQHRNGDPDLPIQSQIPHCIRADSRTRQRVAPRSC